MKKIFLFLFLTIISFCFNIGKAGATELSVVINEIAWMGTATSTSDEWIELYNNSAVAVDLTGWTLIAADGQPSINLTKQIAAYGYFLLERTDETTISDITANQIYTGSLSNEGEKLELKNTAGVVVDSIDCTAGWFAGDNASKSSMERINPATAAEQSNWASNSGVTIKGKDAAGNNLLATAGGQNSVYAGSDQQSGNGNDNNSNNTSSGTLNNNSSSTPPFSAVENSAKYNLGDVVINEFVSDPADGEEEWIELYNAGGKEINLAGWTIEEGSGAKTDLSGKLEASGSEKFKVIEKPKGNLNNGGDIIILRDGFGNLIDQVTYGNWNDGDTNNNAPAASDPASVARKFDGLNSYNNHGDFAITKTATKGAGNIIMAGETVDENGRGNYDYSDDIIISEIFPNPAGDDTNNEFIELYNKGIRDINLKGWKLGDDSAKKCEIRSAKDGNNIIKAGGYFVFYRKESKIALNNTSDSVKLFQPLKDEPLEAVKYSKAVEGWSYNNANIANSHANAANNKWIWSETITPGKENIIKSINHPPVVDFDFPEKIYVGVPVALDSSDTIDEDGDKLIYEWDFGDGIKNNLANPEHTFLKAGVYKVALAVSDGENKVKKEKIMKVFLASLGPTTNGAHANFSFFNKESGEYGEQEIIINEILPSPEGDDKEGEWIELYNKGGEEVNLSGWRLDDSEGGSKIHEFTENIVLGAGKFYVAERAENGLALNNGSDEVRLFNGGGELVDKVKYENAPEGESYARGLNGKWFWTNKLTPGEVNIILVAASAGKKSAGSKKVLGMKIASVALEKVKNYDVGDFIKTAGTVAVKPGVLGSQFFYIVGSPGIQIYNYKKNFPALEVGDYVEVAGELSSINGEMRLKTGEAEDIKIIEHRDEPTAVEISCDKVSEEYVGQLVKIAGEITERKSSTVYLDDGTDEVEVYIKKATGINLSKFKEGASAVITGIASKTKNGVRILPRSNDDILIKGASAEVLGEPSESDEWAIENRNKKAELFKYLLVIAGGVIIVLAVILTKAVRSSKKIM